jgi:hypothetical protein
MIDREEVMEEIQGEKEGGLIHLIRPGICILIHFLLSMCGSSVDYMISHYADSRKSCGGRRARGSLRVEN